MNASRHLAFPLCRFLRAAEMVLRLIVLHSVNQIAAQLAEIRLSELVVQPIRNRSGNIAFLKTSPAAIGQRRISIRIIHNGLVARL